MLRILHSRNVAEAGTEAVVAVVPMEEAEVASTVVVEAADSMEAVAEVIAAEAAERIAAAVVGTAAADRPVILLAAWVPMDAAAAAHMAARVRMARTPAARAAILRADGTAARPRVRGVRIH